MNDMITIKMDIETYQVNGDFKSPHVFQGAKTDPEGIYFEALVRLLEMKNFVGFHEALVGDQYYPYADFDWNEGITKQNFQKREYELLSEAKSMMEKAFPQEEAEVHMFCSSGEKPDGSWKVSAHFVVMGIYFEKKEYIKHELGRALGVQTVAEWKAKGWDAGVYDRNHKLRLPLCTKPGDKRRLRYAEVKSIGDAQFIHHPEMDVESDLACGLITLVAKDARLMPKPATYVEPVKRAKKHDDEDEDEEDGEDEDWSTWTFASAEDVLNRLNDQRAASHKERLDGLFSILHLARAIKKVAKFKELAHTFAKKDPEYSEAQTDDDWDYVKRKKAALNTRTFASLIKFANEDNPVKVVPAVDVEIVLTNYDEIDAVLAKKPSLLEVQTYCMGCLRFCSTKGSEQWFQHSADGWWPIKNRKDNFPFGSTSSNRKFKDTSLFDLMQELQGSAVFKAKCLTTGSVFYPYFGEDTRPDIINTFHGWAHKPSGQCEETVAVKAFVDHTTMMWGKDVGPYVLNQLAKKLRNPRSRGKLGVGYGQFGGEGKNLFEAFITGVFGREYCLSTPGTKHILGQGDAGFNPLAETALFVFIQEAKADGKSIVCNDKFKDWLTNMTQQIRRMRENPYTASNYATTWLWTNFVNSLRADAAMLRRLYAQQISAEKMWDKDYFDRMWQLTENKQALQEIFDWLHDRDISDFKEEDKPNTAFMQRMAEDTLTPLQQYVVGLCNGNRAQISTDALNADEEGNVFEPAQVVYDDYRAYCQENGIAAKFIPSLIKGFKTEMEGMGIIYKQDRHEFFGTEAGNQKHKRGMCFIINAADVEEVIQKLQKKREWKLLRPELDDADA